MEDVKRDDSRGNAKEREKSERGGGTDTNADVRDIFFDLDFADENEAFDSLSGFNVYCEIECVEKGYSRPLR